MANTPVTNGMTVAQMVAIINTIGVQGDNSALSIAELISTMSTKLNAAQVQALIDASGGGGGGSETRESILLKLGISDISGVNTGDQDLTAIISALAGKASQTDFNNLQTAYNAYVASNNSAVASKVAQSVYDTFVSAYNTAISSKVDTTTYTTNKTNTDAAIALKVDQSVYNANKATTDAAILSASVLQAETYAYVKNIIAVNSTIPTLHVNAIDDFIVETKSEGTFSFIKGFAPMLGNNLAGALVKLIIETGGVPSMINVGLAETDYVKGIGFYVNVNNTTVAKQIRTGIIPSVQGLNSGNFGLAYLVADNYGGAGHLFGDNPTTGLPNIYVLNPAQDVSFRGRYMGTTSIGGKGFRMFNVSSLTTYQSYINGALVIDNTTILPITAGSIDTELTIFKDTINTNASYATGNIGCFIVTSGMTKAQSSSLSKSLYRLYQKVGRVKLDGTIYRWGGDSIPTGQGATTPLKRFSYLTSVEMGAVEVNIGAPGTQTRQQGNFGAGLVQRYSDSILALFAHVQFIMSGTNDEGIADATTNGDATIISDYGVQLEAVIQGYLNAGSRVVVLSPPYANDGRNTTKQLAYIARAALAAKNKNVLFVDTYSPMVDTGAPNSYLADTLHLNDAGHLLTSKVITQALKGFVSRSLTIDFASIAADSFLDSATALCYGAKAGMNATATPLTPTAGITYSAYVSADDTIVVRATNISTGAIDPASQVIKVQVNIA